MEIYHKFAVRFAQDIQFRTLTSFRPKDSVLKIDRKFSLNSQQRLRQSFTNLRREAQEKHALQSVRVFMQEFLIPGYQKLYSTGEIRPTTSIAFSYCRARIKPAHSYRANIFIATLNAETISAKSWLNIMIYLC